MYSILGAIIWLLKLKNTFSSMRKKPHGKILKEEPKEQYLNIIPKSLSLSLSIYIYILVIGPYVARFYEKAYKINV